MYFPFLTRPWTILHMLCTYLCTNFCSCMHLPFVYTLVCCSCKSDLHMGCILHVPCVYIQYNIIYKCLFMCTHDHAYGVPILNVLSIQIIINCSFSAANQLRTELHFNPCLKPIAPVFKENQLQRTRQFLIG